MINRESQNKKLAKWLKSGKSISPLQALNKLGIYRLASRVNDLRNDGLKIETKMIHEHPVKFAQYKLK